ncbi:carbon storage regulator CsrA [bacterium]|nr:carbon storage regulator CsrA [bacterium]
MLVLTRKVSERFMIGDDIVVTVVKIDGRQVRIGIDAPRDVVIRRTELKQFEREDFAPSIESSGAAVRSHLHSPRFDPAREIS